MDRRENVEQNLYEKELEQQMKGEQNLYDDHLMIEGKPYRVPYKMVKEVVFDNVKKEEMQDMEHAARLQYRLMLMDPVLRAKVEFVKQKITITYNPAGAENNKEKISLEELVEFLAREGVHVDRSAMNERDFDYFKEMYSYQFDPPSIRERPPYGYTMDEWKRMRDEYYAKTEEGKQEGRAKFKAWQESYAERNPDILGDKINHEEKKISLSERIFGRKEKKKDEKGFWFHGV